MEGRKSECTVEDVVRRIRASVRALIFVARLAKKWKFASIGSPVKCRRPVLGDYGDNRFNNSPTPTPGKQNQLTHLPETESASLLIDPQFLLRVRNSKFLYTSIPKNDMISISTPLPRFARAEGAFPMARQDVSFLEIVISRQLLSNRPRRTLHKSMK